MVMKRYAQDFTHRPQTEPLNERQVPNSAGGFSFPVDGWKRLDRFLILGNEGGSYYAKERELTLENAISVVSCLGEDPVRTVGQITAISVAGRAPKPDPALFALALAVAHPGARQIALDSLPAIARTGTHLFTFMDNLVTLRGRGMGRQMRRGIGRWYTERKPENLALQLCKYRQRGGWRHADVLRLVHARPTNATMMALMRWAARGELSPPLPGSLVEGFIKLQEATHARDAIALVNEYPVTWEMIPTELLGEAEVWQALLPKLPLTALIRNLGRMTANGALGMDEAKTVAAKLGDQGALMEARVHPIQVLSALLTYSAGHGARGSLTWQPHQTIVDALDAAFYMSFGNVPRSEVKHTVALDVSGSMFGGEVAGVPGLSPGVASGALAMVWAAAHPNAEFLAFSTSLVPIAISPRRRLDDVCASMRAIKFGGTDCALPMIDAIRRGVQRDCFTILTDSETWAGNMHPMEALKKYRRQAQENARLCVVGMVSNGFSIADPEDSGSLDVVGFDTATPQLVTQFAEGKL